MADPISRRDVCKLSLAAMAFAVCANASNRVRLGVGTYSFRGLAFDEFIPVTSAAGVSGLELDAAYLEPVVECDALRQWRLSVPLAEFAAHRARMHKASLSVYAINIDNTFIDAEIDALLRMTKALGASMFNTAVPMSIAKRLAPFAARHKIRLGTGSDCLCSPDSRAHHVASLRRGPRAG
jgi:hypothetical protein